MRAAVKNMCIKICVLMLFNIVVYSTFCISNHTDPSGVKISRVTTKHRKIQLRNIQNRLFKDDLLKQNPNLLLFQKI